MKLSFCVTCGDRLHDLRITLPNNIQFLDTEDEIVLLDYGSRDGLSHYIKPYVDRSDKCIRYFSTYPVPGDRPFFRSHAKNVAHLLAKGRILINLDADNFLDTEYMKLIREHDWHTQMMVYPGKSKLGGVKGRLALTQTVFVGLGGYNEQFVHGYGYEEVDLFRRLYSLDRSLVRKIDINSAMTILTPDKDKKGKQIFSLFRSNWTHKRICDRNIRGKRFVANAGQTWGYTTVYDWQGIPSNVGHYTK